MTNQRALANLLDAVEGVLAYDWCDNDADAVEAIDRLRKANDDYGVVQRLAAEPAEQLDDFRKTFNEVYAEIDNACSDNAWWYMERMDRLKDALVRTTVEPSGDLTGPCNGRPRCAFYPACMCGHAEQAAEPREFHIHAEPKPGTCLSFSSDASKPTYVETVRGAQYIPMNGYVRVPVGELRCSKCSKAIASGQGYYQHTVENDESVQIKSAHLHCIAVNRS
jgi:hypothetical protein